MRRNRSGNSPVVAGIAELYKGLDIPSGPVLTPGERLAKAARPVIGFFAEWAEDVASNYRANHPRRVAPVLSIVPDIEVVESDVQLLSPARHLHAVPDLPAETTPVVETVSIVADEQMRVTTAAGQASVAGFIQDLA